jgi:hypothetical protein
VEEGGSGAWWRGIWKPLVVVNVVNVSLTFLGLAYGLAYYNTFGLLCILESALALMAAGGTEMNESAFGVKLRGFMTKKEVVYSPKRHREARRTANAFILTAAIIFGEGLAVSLLFYL